MYTEKIKALRSEIEALRMLVIGIEKRLAEQQILLDQWIEEAEQEASQPVPTQSVEIPEEESKEQPQAPSLSQEEMPTEQPATNSPTSSLNDLLERKNLSDFRKAFNLNDRFRFKRELFGGSEALMNQVITDLNEIKSYEESMAYINKVLNRSGEETAMADFLQLIEKRFA